MISICMATYNGERYIKEQIASILPQLTHVDEIIITDDGSTDRTEEYVNTFSDSRIKFIKNPMQLGYIKNFEHALSLASGDIVFLSDQDDIWLPGKIIKMSQTLAESNCNGIVCDAKIINDNNEILQDSYFQKRKSKAGFWQNLYKNSYHGCCMAVKRTVIEMTIPFPISSVPHDYLLGAVADLTGGVIFYKEKLVLHRRHENNASSTNPRDIVTIFISRVAFIIDLISVFSRIVYRRL